VNQLQKTGLELVQRYLTTSKQRLQLCQDHILKEIERKRNLEQPPEANVTIPNFSGTRDCDQREYDLEILTLQLLLEEVKTKTETLELLIGRLNDLPSPFSVTE